MSTYRDRIKRGLARGLSVSQARGHPSRASNQRPSERRPTRRFSVAPGRPSFRAPAVRDRMLAAQALGSVRSGDYPTIRDAGKRAYGLPAGTVARQLPCLIGWTRDSS